MNTGNRARISWSQISEQCHRHGEPVVPQWNARPEKDAADRIDSQPDQGQEEKPAECLVDPRKPCSVADKVLLNGGHSDHDLVNQR